MTQGRGFMYNYFPSLMNAFYLAKIILSRAPSTWCGPNDIQPRQVAQRIQRCIWELDQQSA